MLLSYPIVPDCRQRMPPLWMPRPGNAKAILRTRRVRTTLLHAQGGSEEPRLFLRCQLIQFEGSERRWSIAPLDHPLCFAHLPARQCVGVQHVDIKVDAKALA